MLFEELNECKAKFEAETCTNLDLVIWEVRMNANIIKPIYARFIGICMFSLDCSYDKVEGLALKVLQ